MWPCCDSAFWIFIVITYSNYNLLNMYWIACTSRNSISIYFNENCHLTWLTNFFNGFSKRSRCFFPAWSPCATNTPRTRSRALPASGPKPSLAACTPPAKCSRGLATWWFHGRILCWKMLKICSCSMYSKHGGWDRKTLCKNCSRVA